MKRTLLETLGALAVVVLMASYHHQISRLKTQQADVATLREIVQGAVAEVHDRADVAEAGKAALDRMGTRLLELEARVAEASATGGETVKLRSVLEATRREASLFQSKVNRDVNQTRELVDAFHREVQSADRIAKESIGRTRANLQDLTSRLMPDLSRLDDQLLSPTVQLNGDDTVGSGTLIYSQYNPRVKKVESYVITSYHVIRNILADTPSSRRTGIAVTIYSRDGNRDVRGDMVSHDERIDAALLRIRGEEKFDKAARAVTRSRSNRVRVWEQVYAVGCPLGNDPIPSRGEISSVSNELSGSNYWMINAPTYFGNSGGGIYLAETRELVGVFSKIYTHGKGNPVVVPHMGLCTPMDLIYEWLELEKLEFVLKADQAVAPDLTTVPAAPGQ